MVLAERNSEIVRNGRRSRGPSPNGHGTGIGGGTPDTSSDDDNSIKRNGKSKTKQSEYEEKIRVGRDYQAVCPPIVSEIERKPEVLNDRALLVWSPTKEIPDNKLEEYITVAKEKYGYNGEQALGMLFWHKHDLERAVMDLANFTPFPDEWTVEDKVLFEQAFQFHGKSFHRIRQMLPDKSIASLVKYYYSWKKSRHRQSVMDRQEKLKASKEGSEGSDNGSNDDSDNDDKDQAMASSSGLQESKLSIGGGETTTIAVLSKNNKTNITPMSLANNNNNSNNNNSNSGSQIHGSSTNISNTITTNANNNAIVVSTTSSGAIAATANNSVTGGGSSNVSSSSIKRQQQHQTQNENNNSLNSNANGSQSNNSNSEINAAAAATPMANAAGSNQTAGGCCAGCGVACNILNATPHGKLCNSCHHHWRRTGNKRPTSGPYFGKRYRDRNADRHKRKPPRGMHINHDDIVALASSNNNQDELLANTEREIVSLLSQVQLNKQNISLLKRKNSESLEDVRPNDNPNRINSRWTNDELLLAVRGVRKYGKDFQTIADTIGTKTEAHVRTFYVNYRRRYNLDQVLKDFEADKEAANAATAAAVAAAAAATAAANQKDEQKKKESSVCEENSSDKAGLSEKNSSKIIETPPTAIAIVQQKDNVILEIDLDNETMDSPPSKKLALCAQDIPKPSAV